MADEFKTDTVNRRIELRIPTGTTRVDKHGDKLESYLTLAVSHDKDRKRYVVFLDREVRGPIFVSTVIDFGSGAPDIVREFRYAVPSTGRYSLKTMQSIFDDVMIDWHDTMLDKGEAREWADKLLDRD